jgi:hypothetical protein
LWVSHIETPTPGKTRDDLAMSSASAKDWQAQSIAALAGLTPDRLPAAEILLLDSLAVYLMGPGAPARPYTIEHGTVAAGHLLRALADCSRLRLEEIPQAGPGPVAARSAIVEGAHAFARRGGPGVQRLVGRFVAAAVGELEVHRESAESQTRSLFYYGLLAVASGPENRLTPAASDGVGEIFRDWNDRIGAGFVPPWRVLGSATPTRTADRSASAPAKTSG